MRRFAAGLLILGAATPALAGCGASDAIDPAVVANAADRTAGAGEARMAMTVQAAGPTIHGSGLMDLRRRRFEMTMQIPGAGAMEMRYLGQVMYMHLPAAARKTVGGKPWVKIDVVKALKSKGIDISGLQGPTGGNPSDTLQQLRGAGDVHKVGTATIRGTQTTHYKATIDLRRAADRVPAAQRAAARQSIDRLVKLTGQTTMPVEAWIDGQGRLRRETFTQTVKGRTVSGTIDLYGFGGQQAIVAPPAGDTADITGRTSAAMGG